MGLSVGVVSIDYLDEPQPPVSDFLKDLVLNPNLGMEDWGGGWEGNSFFEFEQAVLTERADNWCTERDIDANGRTAMMAWLSSLTWRSGYIMLHLGV